MARSLVVVASPGCVWLRVGAAAAAAVGGCAARCNRLLEWRRRPKYVALRLPDSPDDHRPCKRGPPARSGQARRVDASCRARLGESRGSRGCAFRRRRRCLASPGSFAALQGRGPAAKPHHGRAVRTALSRFRRCREAATSAPALAPVRRREA